jgi:putative ABC transport system permease protein
MKNNSHPPFWIDRFLRWRLPEEEFEEVQGDMHELYSYWIVEAGEKKANLKYALNAFTFLRPLPRRNNIFQPGNQYLTANPLTMIHNYFTIAFRNLLRHNLRLNRMPADCPVCAG